MPSMSELGVAVCAVTYGVAKSFAGGDLKVTMSTVAKDDDGNPLRLVWDPTGTVFSAFTEDDAPQGTEAARQVVAVTGQVGFVRYDNIGGVATKVAVSEWFYETTVTEQLGNAAPKTEVFRYQPTAGTTEVHLERLPVDGSVPPGTVEVVVPAVTSVNGLTGDVVLTVTGGGGAGVTSYNDLTDKPTIPAVPADIGAQPAGDYATTSDLSSGLSSKVNTSTYTAGLATKADLVGGLVPTSQIPALALTNTVVVASQTAMLALTTSQVQPGDLAVRTDGAGTFILTATDPSVLGNWTRLNAPTDLVVSVAGQTGTVVLAKGDVGLGLVDNTSDVSKPVSTATQNALDLKAPLASPTFTGTVSGVTKAMVGLANVDNTSDANKPVSTAQATAIGAKADSSALTAHTGNTANPHAVTKAQVGLGNVDNTADASKPVSTAQQTALDGKAPSPVPSHAGLRAAPFDAGKSVYNADAGALRTLRTLLTKSRAGICRIAFIGDSVTAGSGGTPGTDDPATRLRERIQGLGVPVGELVWLANRATGGALADSRITLAGTWGAASTNFAYIFSSTNGSTLTYKSAVPGTVLEIEYSNGSGTFTYSIDGATAVSVTGTNAGANARVTVTGLSNQRHTVVITQSGTVENDFAAIGVRQTTGVVLINAGIGGSGSADWSADTSWFRPLGTLATASPDIAVVELGLNDGYYGTMPVATFKTNVTAIITYLTAAGVKPLLTASQVLPGPFVSALYDLADTYDAPLLDLRDRVGGDTTTTAAITGDGVHFTAQGNLVKARAWADLLHLDATVNTQQVYSLPGAFTLEPRVGQYAQPPGMLTAGNGAVVNQRLTLSPFWVGPQGWVFDAFRVLVGVAAVGGAGLSFNAALYGDDGTGWPDLTNRLAVGNSADFTLATTGTRTSVLGTAVSLSPGLYWIATLYQYTTVPTTAPQLSCFSNVSWQISLPSGTNVGTVPRGLIVTGQTALPTTAFADSSYGVSGSTDVPLVALRRSA